MGRRFVRQMEGLLGRQSLLGKGGRTPLLKELNLVADLFELQRDSGLKVSHLRLQTITGGANGVFNLAPCFLRDGLHLLFAICVLPGVRLLIVVYYVHPGWESGQHAVPARPAEWESMRTRPCRLCLVRITRRLAAVRLSDIAVAAVGKFGNARTKEGRWKRCGHAVFVHGKFAILFLLVEIDAERQWAE